MTSRPMFPTPRTANWQPQNKWFGRACDTKKGGCAAQQRIGCKILNNMMQALWCVLAVKKMNGESVGPKLAKNRKDILGKCLTEHVLTQFNLVKRLWSERSSAKARVARAIFKNPLSSFNTAINLSFRNPIAPPRNQTNPWGPWQSPGAAILLVSVIPPGAT